MCSHTIIFIHRCTRDSQTKVEVNGLSQKAQFSFEAFRFVEHKNMTVSTFYLHCTTRLCEVATCQSLLPVSKIVFDQFTHQNHSNVSQLQVLYVKKLCWVLMIYIHFQQNCTSQSRVRRAAQDELPNATVTSTVIHVNKQPNGVSRGQNIKTFTYTITMTIHIVNKHANVKVNIHSINMILTE